MSILIAISGFFDTVYLQTAQSCNRMRLQPVHVSAPAYCIRRGNMNVVGLGMYVRAKAS